MSYVDRERTRIYQREWIANRRAEFLAGKACVDCGATASLEIDHIDPAQKASHNFWSWTKERREAELRKCAVRCHTCHVRRHIALRRKPTPHGTANGYDWYRCRCHLCKSAKVSYQRELRERRRMNAAP